MAKELSKSFAEIKKTVENLESSISDLSSDLGTLEDEIGEKIEAIETLQSQIAEAMMAQLQVMVDNKIKEAQERRANVDSNVDAPGVGNVRPEPQER